MMLPFYDQATKTVIPNDDPFWICRVSITYAVAKQKSVKWHPFREGRWRRVRVTVVAPAPPMVSVSTWILVAVMLRERSMCDCR